MRSSFIIILFVILVSSISKAASSEHYVVTLPNGNNINAEIAEDKAQGLQNRENLCAGCGMIFIFETEGLHSFWMKDTLIELSMIWINNEGEVVHIVRNAMPCKYNFDAKKECEVYRSNKNAKYVLEILPSASSSIKLGSKLKITRVHE